jgi:hypothetical protein
LRSGVVNADRAGRRGGQKPARGLDHSPVEFFLQSGFEAVHFRDVVDLVVFEVGDEEDVHDAVGFGGQHGSVNVEFEFVEDAGDAIQEAGAVGRSDLDDGVVLGALVVEADFGGPWAR